MSSYKTLVPLSILCAILIGHSYIESEWIEPGTGNYADTNTPAPINVSTSTQVKLGALGTGALSVTGNASVSGVLLSGASTAWSPARARFQTGADWFEIRPGFRGSTPAAGYTTLEQSGRSRLFVWDDLEVENDIITDERVMASSFCDPVGGTCTTAAAILDTTGTAQVKTGALGTGALSVSGNASVSGIITIGGACFRPASLVTCYWNWRGDGHDTKSVFYRGGNPQSACTSNHTYQSHITILAQC